MLSNLNSILFEGRLLEDPKVIVTAPEGEHWDKMVKITIANTYYSKEDEGEEEEGGRSETTIISCIAFGDLADKIVTHLKANMMVRVLGRLRCTKWTTKDGQERKNFEIVCHNFC